MATIHVVSHTHWDREWYQTFQQFRLRLVHMLDKLLAILSEDPDYRYFMLDGQTVVLEDYLEMRPEREAELRAHIADGRILIGPWRCLPDEFLVSPESIIRNLLQGRKDCARFGRRMEIGYIPDTFGHIGQMPQIVHGFGMATACVWRGLAEEPCELWWEAPDGTRVLLAYLRESYSNATGLPASSLDQSTTEIRTLAEALMPHVASAQVLLMHGTDHQEPHRETSQMLAYASSRLEGHTLVHSTLPAYLEAMQTAMERLNLDLPVVRGELRDCRRQHLLPGVLSSRMWIKQRNHACETLLEKWAEPFSAWVGILARRDSDGLAQLPKARHIDNPAPLIRRAWRLLMECHPHDSICGCSIDQVHREMVSRFDQVEQVGEEIVQQSLQALSLQIDTMPKRRKNEEWESALVVYNPVDGPRTDLVSARIFIPLGMDDIAIRDDTGNPVPHAVLQKPKQTEVFNAELDRETLRGMLDMARAGRIPGMKIGNIGLVRQGRWLSINIALYDAVTDNSNVLQAWEGEIDTLLADPTLERFHVHAVLIAYTTLLFTAADVPGYGYKTYWATAADRQPDRQRPISPGIENEFFRVEADPNDGTVIVTDKRNGTVYTGLNRFVDGGDCGDEYNFCPPSTDLSVDARSSARVHSLRVDRDACRQAIEIALSLPVPEGLQDDRHTRSEKTAAMMIVTRVVLVDSLERIDIMTHVENPARDHRLRVHFPVPVRVDRATYDGHFEVLERPIELPAYDATWVEDPRPEVPQRSFTDVSDGKMGLMLANRGLPEVEVLRVGQGMEIALTLLRCVGWLSRDDFPTRKGHAGPPLMATPDAQMPGAYTFAYALIPHTGSWRRCYRQAEAFRAPLRAVATAMHEGPLPSMAAFLRVEPPEFVVSAVKNAEDGEGIIIRGYNISADDINVTLTPLWEFSSASRCLLDETRETALPGDPHGGVCLPARGHAILTVRLE